MKHIFLRFQLVLCALILCVASLWAVPAKPGWQTKTQPDGTPVTVQLMGDEFCHYWMTQDGKIAKEQSDGTFIVMNEDIPTGEQVAQRRMASKRYQRRAKMVGSGTMPPRALFILVSFSNQAFKSTSETYYKSKLGETTEGAMSMYNYLKQQSNGKYAPPVDVYGPYTLSNTYATYGTNDSDGDDQDPAQMIVDACNAANADVDFSLYDGNNDGWVDNVYVLYAGKGEADGGAESTIWPHQWNITYGNKSLTVDGKKIGAYACSAELNGSNQCAMGTPLHEFGHVIGLPDYYDTKYESTNYTESRTPGEWSIMDQGSYNNNGNTPPNYSIFDKYYLGWVTPKFLAKDVAANVTLTTDVTDGYQITGGTSRVSATATSPATIYYIENRQQTGWDQYLPGHGMIVWQVKYNSSAWSGNTLNNTGGSPRYTVLSASGTETNIGKSTDPFPGTGKVKTWTKVTGCEMTDITESSGVITFKYNGGIDCHNVVVDATGCTIEPNSTCVENSTQLTATITPTDGTYDFTSLTVKRGSTTLTSGTHYTLSSDKKSLTINASAISGSISDAITITAVWTKNRYSYAMLGENCTEELEGAVNMNNNSGLDLTIAPDAGYSLADAACWDVTMGGNPLTYGTGFTYNNSTNIFSITTVTGDVEIMAYGLPSVTWYADGSVHATNVAVDDKITLPANPADCASGKKFVGWCTISNYSHASTAPTFAKTGDAYSVDTYYAVYATDASGSAPRRATMAESPSEGTYKIYAQVGNNKYYVAGGTSGKLSNTTNAADAAVYTFETVTGGIAIKSGNAYLGYGTSGTDFATKSEQYAWVFSTGTHGTWRVTSKSTTNRAIVYRAGSTNKFGPYATSNINGTEYYDIEIEQVGGSGDSGGSGGGGDYTDYSTSCGASVVCALESISLNTSGATTTFTTGDTFSSTGLVVTASYSNCSSKTVTPNSISSPDMSTAGQKTITVSYTENGTTKSATYTITVSNPVTYTVTWSVNGTTTPETYKDGQALALPSTPSDCSGDNGKKFVGWTASSSVNGSAPADLFTEASGKVTADATYYAVYATASGSGSLTPTKATSITAGDKVIFVCESASMEMTSISTYGVGSAYSETPAGTYVFEVEAGSSNGTFSFKNGSDYISWSSGNSLAKSETKNANSSWNVTFSSGNANITNANTSDRKLRWNSGSPRFACYTSAQTAIQLYKAGSGNTTTYSDYSLTCSTPVVCALASITLNTSGATTTFTTGTTFSYEGLVMTANYSNCADAVMTPTSVSSPDMSTAGQKTITVSYTENGATQTATYTITVSDPVIHTVTWSVNGTTTPVVYNEGAALALPSTTPSDCSGDNGKKFVGWTASSSVNGSAPADLFTEASGIVTANATYYAVYATANGSGGGAFDGNTEGNYKIYADVNGTKYYATGSGKKISSTTNEAEATEYAFAKVTGGWSIKAGDVFITYSSSTDLGTSSSAYTWTLSAGSHGTWRVASGTSGRAWIYRAGTTNQFGGYSTNNVNGTEYYDLEIGGGSGGTTYSDYSLECSAPVVCALTSITLNTDNAKTSFYVGDSFTHDGVVVTANYSNCDSKTVNGFYTVPDMSSAGTKTVNVSYTENGVTKEASYEINVVCELTSITLNTASATTTFDVGDIFTSEGVVVTAHYNSCDNKTVDGFYTVPDMSSAGTKTVNVSYTENGVTKETSYDITVVQPVYYTVTWIACGDTIQTETYREGAHLAFPTSPGANAGKAFYGWTTTQHYTGTSAPPIISEGGEVNANATYYAVYK